MSDVTVSRIERGHLESLSFAVVRRVARVLEARLELSLWTRAGLVERVASALHAELGDGLIATLGTAGWIARPEVSFNLRAERGIVDVVAWHPETQTLLLIEVKTEVVDIGELFGTFDRKRRLGFDIGRQMGLDPKSVAAALVIGDTHTNHRRVARHAATFGAALPDDGRRFRAFVRRPTGDLAALAFWPFRHPGTVRRRGGGVRRVRRPSMGPRALDPRSANETPSRASR
jgi:hypothetical protein